MDIDEIKKRIEFNETDGEVLINLIESANEKGSEISRTFRLIKEQSKKVFKDLSSLKKIIFTIDDLKDYGQFRKWCSVGIDGSFYSVGPIGSKWYAPYSIVRILFEKGLLGEPVVDVYAAGIEEIDENKHKSIDGEASRRMLLGETKALEDWNTKNTESIVFIDGPVVDPPCYIDENYVEYRCDAIKKATSQSLLVGCVKKCIDSHFLREYERILKLERNKLLKNFSVDKNLFAYFFTAYRLDNNYDDVLFTHPLELKDEISRRYSNYGIRIFSVFFQKDFSSEIIRLDIPMKYDKGDVNLRVQRAVTASYEWTFPGQNIPVPIEIAHEKCKIRGGAAQVIYEEILARTHATGSIEDMIIINNMG